MGLGGLLPARLSLAPGPCTCHGLWQKNLSLRLSSASLLLCCQLRKPLKTPHLGLVPFSGFPQPQGLPSLRTRSSGCAVLFAQLSRAPSPGSPEGAGAKSFWCAMALPAPGDIRPLGNVWRKAKRLTDGQTGRQSDREPRQGHAVINQGDLTRGSGSGE